MGLSKFNQSPVLPTLKPFLQVLFLTWVLFRCLHWYGRWHAFRTRKKLASEFAQELRRRGLIGTLR
jgi:hypothetical protein